MRGTGQQSHTALRNRRFIPACAGNSRLLRCTREIGAVHPRVCGEQNQPVTASNQTCGSSPRVRGTACEYSLLPTSARFIPACAGNREPSARLCTKIAQVRAQKIPLAATSSRACSRRKMIPRKSPIPCHRFRWNLDHPQTRHTKIYNIQLFNYPIYLPNSAGPKIRATVQPHFLNSTLCIE